MDWVRPDQNLATLRYNQHTDTLLVIRLLHRVDLTGEKGARMTRLLHIFAALGMTLASSSAFADRLVVIELYTSQGCSSCPPADEILFDIHGTHDDVLALTFHVDYWDYLGWKDAFAKPEFTDRQAAYNENLNSRYRLVTPQMIFDGRAEVAGARTIKIFQALTAAQKGRDLAALSVTIADGKLLAEVSPIAGSEPADVYMVRYGVREDVKIERGENRGHTLSYLNTVSDWSTLGTWDGQSTTTFEAEMTGDDEAAIIIQVAGAGPVLAARKALGD